MVKLALAIIIFTLFLEIHGVKRINFTRQWTTKHAYRPYVVKLNHNLVTVGIYKNVINVTSVDADFRPCEIPLHTDKLADNRIQAMTLGNGKIIVQSVLITGYREKSRVTSYIFIVVEPKTCTIFSSEIPIQTRRSFIGLVPYQNTFDVFFSNPDNSSDIILAPRKYNDKAEAIESPYSLGAESQTHSYSITTIKPNDPSEGYLYSSRLANDTTILKLLNDKFEVVKQLTLNHTVGSYSTGYGNISICHSSHISSSKRDCVICDMMDANLKIRMSTHMHYVDEGKYYAFSSIRNLADGGAMVALAHDHSLEKSHSHDVEIYVQRVGSDGRNSEPMEFRRFSNRYYFMYEILLDSGEYCLIVIDETEPFAVFSDPEVTVNANCIATIN